MDAGAFAFISRALYSLDLILYALYSHWALGAEADTEHKNGSELSGGHLPLSDAISLL